MSAIIPINSFGESIIFNSEDFKIKCDVDYLNVKGDEMKNVLDMNNYKIINVRNGEKDNDVVTFRQVKYFTNYIKDATQNFEIYGKEILDIKNRLDSDVFYLEKNRKDKTFKLIKISRW